MPATTCRGHRLAANASIETAVAGDEGRGLRVPDQAGRAAPAARAPRQRGGEGRGRARGHRAASAPPGGARHGAAARHEPPDARGLPAHRPGRADLGPCAHHGGDGHRQGAGRADDSRSVPAVEAAVRGRQLLRHSRGPRRERVLRLREGRVHGSDGAAGGLLRACRRGHDLPRRDHGDEPEAPGQVPAHAAGWGGPAPGRQARSSRWTSGSSPPPTRSRFRP